MNQELTASAAESTGIAWIELTRAWLARFPLSILVLAGRISLFLGLATRIATIPLLGMIAVIQIFVYPNAYNDHLVWGSILVLVLTRGPGVFSLDYLIERIVRRRRAATRRL